MMDPDISVIIILTEWTDAEKKTVESVLLQDFPREKMEIIAIMNRLNNEMNDFLESCGIISIYTGKESLGAMISLGVEKSNSPLVTFLKGGDQYTPDRVSQSVDLVNEDERNMYHHSSIEPLKKNCEPDANIRFNNIDYDLYTGQDDVPLAYPQVMRANAARHVSAITCRKTAIADYLVLLNGINTSVDIALLAVCLQNGGRFMFDTSARTRCIIGVESESDRSLIEREREFHEARLRDMEMLERSLSQQMPKDIARAERIYSDIALSFLSNDKDRRLSVSRMFFYFMVGLFEHYKEFRYWMRAGLSEKLFPGRGRKKFIEKLVKEPWNMRM